MVSAALKCLKEVIFTEDWPLGWETTGRPEQSTANGSLEQADPTYASTYFICSYLFSYRVTVECK